MSVYPSRSCGTNETEVKREKDGYFVDRRVREWLRTL